MSARTWPDGRHRSMGGPFDILYQPRAIAESCTPPIGSGAKPGARKALDAKGRAVVDLDPHFRQSITIGSPKDADKTASIVGRRNGARSQ